MNTYLLVFVGGGLGSLARLYLALKFNPSGQAFPWGTFGANLLAALIIGFLFGLKAKGQLNASTQFLLATGFCGGFSTFSTFSWEMYNFVLQGNWFLAGTYILSSTLLCLLGVWVGFSLA
jgi:fluoride exporter